MKKQHTLCRRCGKPSPLGKNGYQKKFCSRDCELFWRRDKLLGNQLRKGLRNASSFCKGHVPWNKNVKGIHLSPHSEFIVGHKHNEEYPVGTVKVRKHKDDKPRAWVKVADRCWRTRATVVWELGNGPVPDGFIVHHKDRNTLNDDLSNLELLSKAAHMNEHRNDLRKRIN